ncbi:TraR/DksA C4-type zinc finger protein [Streptomyces sp. NA02950]|uniref:TraR/DksA family transcriptional regulator n=1 Tax=Streptomyces sp. NA02950 TaxID=2742137 RepID=UPI001590AA14|nr:TraR/DksA C4-type zinc finger protein [Streptomyces sp. NA02950]QKV95490.1 TraR/DksA C4-type zinc finger protein [Streptomyces sp. NA02950]
MVARKTAVQKSTAKATQAAPAKTQAAPAKKSASGKKAAKKTAAATKSTAEATAKAAKKSAPTKKATAKKAAPAKKAVPAKKTGARKVVAKKSPGGAPSAKKATTTAPPVPKARAAGAPADPSELAVRPGEDPWSAEEVTEARTGLLTEAGRLRTEILASEEAITGLMRDSGDGAGDDQADTGTKNITREHEMALAGNAREMLHQTERALERLDTGTYGLCENCGNAIGKARMQAFPRATLCVECKQRQERR